MFSIIIPTMQRNIKVLNMLLSELVDDNIIGEIIIIDNSLKGVNFKSEKIKVITPEENVFVNPAWNIGVESAKNEFIGILNDDLIFPKNFFSDVFNFIKSNAKLGYVGLDTIEKTDEENFFEYPPKLQLIFNRINSRNLCWGSAIFFLKNNYFKIPEELKVWCGDDYLFGESINNGFVNYAISNSNILHLHSLTSDLPEFSEIKYNDQKLYKTINPDYPFERPRKLTMPEKIFSVRNNFEDGIKYKEVLIFGIKIYKKFI